MHPRRFRKSRRYQTIPIRIEDTKPYVTTPVVLADGTQFTAKLLIDSGASHGLMLDPMTDDRIRVPERFVSSVIGRGLGGEITGKIGRVEELHLGNYVLEDAIVSFPDPNSYFDSLKLSNTDRNGAIGGESLSRFTVIFNFPKEEMYLKKNGSFRKPFHFNLSGITVKAKGAYLDVYEITAVRRESAAAKAGVQEGDIIVSVNGLAGSALSLNLINAMFNHRPGKKLSLVLERDGQRLKKEFRLEDQI